MPMTTPMRRHIRLGRHVCGRRIDDGGSIGSGSTRQRLHAASLADPQIRRNRRPDGFCLRARRCPSYCRFFDSATHGRYMPSRFPALRGAALAGFLSLAACAGHEEARIGSIAEVHPTPAHYSLCHGNGCRLHTDISLSTAEWQEVRAIFTPPAADAVAERKLISLAVGRLEIL